jgi:glycosyltransferase involved in cell wall biosynthesis
MSSPLLSVVICFRDWGLDRLLTAVRAHFLSAGNLPIEVIVSDYGSQNANDISNAVSQLGARVVRTNTTLPWSRSASLNAGVSAAQGHFVITTDADILFKRACYTEVIRMLEQNSDALYLIQCRDLPVEWGANEVDALISSSKESNYWETILDSSSSIRPRWGMGGFAAFEKSRFDLINGYEERMQIWGGEDNDFATRFRRAGYPLRWLSKPETRIFHIWHEPSQSKATETVDGKSAISRNKEILKNDFSTIRNYNRVTSFGSMTPSVTVVIPTYRRAALLRICLESCQRQTFKNFEVVVVENGDSDEAALVVESLSDPRFRYIKTTKKGASIARNVGVDIARGRYIVIHDDDDIMITTRIEDHLRAMKPGVAGTYSGWIDFEHSSGKVLGCYPGKEFSFSAILCNGKVLTHGALMLDRNIFKVFRYAEGLAAGIDYGFILLLSRNGLRLAHTGTYGILRCMHQQNMTHVSADEQKSAALHMAEIIKREIKPENYQVIRNEGLAAPLLSCQNEYSALAELFSWHDGDSLACPENFESISQIHAWLDGVDPSKLDALLINSKATTKALVLSCYASRLRRV